MVFSTLLEWDAQIPPFEVVHAEVLKAKFHMNEQLPIGETHSQDNASDQTGLPPSTPLCDTGRSISQRRSNLGGWTLKSKVLMQEKRRV